MRIERRGIGLVLAVVAAIALVTLAARGDHVATGESSVPGPVSSVSQAVALVAVAVAGLAMVALVLWTIVPRGHKPIERPKRSKWKLLGVLLFIAVLAVAGRLQNLDDHEQPPQAVPDLRTVEDERDRKMPPSSQPAWPLGIGGVALLVIVGGALLLGGRRRPAEAGPVMPATPEARTAAVDEAVLCADPRQAILLAFAAAEVVLSDPATARPPSTSPREWSRAVPIPALTSLVGRYEIARYSRHAVTEADRTVALDALRALR